MKHKFKYFEWKDISPSKDENPNKRNVVYNSEFHYKTKVSDFEFDIFELMGSTIVSVKHFALGNITNTKFLYSKLEVPMDFSENPEKAEETLYDFVCEWEEKRKNNNTAINNIFEEALAEMNYEIMPTNTVIPYSNSQGENKC